MDSIERSEFIRKEFKKYFGSQPEMITRAPGRVDLMGSHTDYNEGYVLTQAVDRDTWLAALPRPDRTVKNRLVKHAGFLFIQPGRYPKIFRFVVG